jgi:hypothetical protein
MGYLVRIGGRGRCPGLLGMLPAVLLIGNFLPAQTVRVQLVNGRSGKPIAKVHLQIQLADEKGPSPTLTTNRKGEIQFESRGVRTFRVYPVGQVDCGEQAVGAPKPTYSVAEALETGLRTQNNCGAYNPQPVPGRLIYIVRAATWLELFRN